MYIYIVSNMVSSNYMASCIYGIYITTNTMVLIVSASYIILPLGASSSGSLGFTACWSSLHGFSCCLHLGTCYMEHYGWVNYRFCCLTCWVGVRFVLGVSASHRFLPLCHGFLLYLCLEFPAAGCTLLTICLLSFSLGVLLDFLVSGVLSAAP